MVGSNTEQDGYLLRFPFTEAGRLGAVSVNIKCLWIDSGVFLGDFSFPTELIDDQIYLSVCPRDNWSVAERIDFGGKIWGKFPGVLVRLGIENPRGTLWVKFSGVFCNFNRHPACREWAHKFHFSRKKATSQPITPIWRVEDNKTAIRAVRL